MDALGNFEKHTIITRFNPYDYKMYIKTESFV